MMITTETITITVEALINGPVEIVWEFWTDPRHIVHWNKASDDWHTSWAHNDVRNGGKFSSRMESRDGKEGFEFTGIYLNVEYLRIIEYIIDDGRKVKVSFISEGDKTRIIETFGAEQMNTIEAQQSGWQSILDNFRKYVERSEEFENLHFEVLINSSPENVFRTLTDEKQFSEWTSAFNPFSYYEGSWKKGSQIKFLGVDKNGNTGGMIGRIKENIPGRFISIEYIGIIKNGKEITDGSEAQEWKDALENYTITEQDGRTLLSIDANSNHEFSSYFKKTWPEALKKLKSMCENNK